MATNLRNIKANALFSSVPSMTVTGNSTIDNVNLTGNIIPDVSIHIVWVLHHIISKIYMWARVHCMLMVRKYLKK